MLQHAISLDNDIYFADTSIRVITVFTVFRLLTDFVCLYNYEFWLSLCKIVRSSVILLLPLLINDCWLLVSFVEYVSSNYSCYKTTIRRLTNIKDGIPTPINETAFLITNLYLILWSKIVHYFKYPYIQQIFCSIFYFKFRQVNM